MASGASGSGHSRPPLARKLGLKPGMRVRLVGAPDHYWELLGSDPAGLELVELERGSRDGADFTHLFARRLDVLRRSLAEARRAMDRDGSVWISWPKKSSGVESEVGRAQVMREGQAVGLVDVKVCSVDETWSALKFVIPLELRPLEG